jgi:hypothetical protein
MIASHQEVIMNSIFLKIETETEGLTPEVRQAVVSAIRCSTLPPFEFASFLMPQVVTP